ncbi:similar to Saccharomyces cerevisiae YHR181W SVP26 Integral membrane protein of the early Golgi apparatus and endoplasmic reticulum, involved in COP II vesicle transport [Maudiozyma saulgeensis]|uniref:Similar to Saccharomyces cerevisiae YHR181W SVP26 Integral membrane protein of the early Golgi apparatus and endoplasmic reticulum, involved in COP II vesicle transport n=1 Tax=Maudiozyma saulgeensis TaxID=1789683 RepID=A0A1X7RAM2_9SACH|nr:similar to Saccharomyces cerevisiae YHR181W SVP26 Integral membrane protein of the early Golgi apparatus and endoplasmic reticulum, involved in COP II vesicle transport [Kazachstania saulgeensis]
MGAVLQLLSMAGSVLGFVFLTLCIASGLYYISEIVEEHTEPTRRFLTRTIWVIEILLLLLLIFDKFPIKLTIFAMGSHMLYYQNLKKFPYISLTSITFLSSCIVVVMNHYLWFKHFNEVDIPPQFHYDPNYVPPRRATFSQVSSFFAICIWFMPFALFVSLSAGDYVLPTTVEQAKKTDEITELNSETTAKLRGRTIGLARVVIHNVRKYIYSVLALFGIQVQRDYDNLGI